METKEPISVYATEAEADALYITRAETDAKGIATLLGLTVQRVYQLEKQGLFQRTAGGGYNLADTLTAYELYKVTGEIPPPSDKQRDAGYFMEITADTTVTEAQLAALLGTTPAQVERLTKAGVLPEPEHTNGIAEYVGLSAIKELDLQSILEELGEPQDRIDLAIDRRDALIEAVEAADRKPQLSRSKRELTSVQELFNDFMDAMPVDIISQLDSEE